MSEFRLGNMTLAFDDSGGDLPPLVLIHGLSGSRATWNALVPHLTDRFRAVRFDQRGHGESSHAPVATYTLKHYVPDAIAFCEEVVKAPALVVGHSLGGVVAAMLGQDRPDLVRGVFLEDPPLYRTEDAEPDERGVSRMFPVMHQVLTDMRARGAVLEEYESMIAATPALNGQGTMGEILGAEGVRGVAATFRRMDPDVFVPAIDRTALATVDTSRRIACPVCVLRADPDRGAAFTPSDEARFLATNPHAIVVPIERASHAVHDEQPERFLAELSAFADRIGG